MKVLDFGLAKALDVLFSVPGVINRGRFVVTPDGQRFLMPVGRVEALPITVLLNWAAGREK